jgi:hypothetical protein
MNFVEHDTSPFHRIDRFKQIAIGVIWCQKYVSSSAGTLAAGQCYVKKIDYNTIVMWFFVLLYFHLPFTFFHSTAVSHVHSQSWTPIPHLIFPLFQNRGRCDDQNRTFILCCFRKERALSVDNIQNRRNKCNCLNRFSKPLFER